MRGIGVTGYKELRMYQYHCSHLPRVFSAKCCLQILDVRISNARLTLNCVEISGSARAQHTLRLNLFHLPLPYTLRQLSFSVSAFFILVLIFRVEYRANIHLDASRKDAARIALRVEKRACLLGLGKRESKSRYCIDMKLYRYCSSHNGRSLQKSIGKE